MPTGTPHSASAQQAVSGHLTIGVHVATWRDVVSRAWAAAAADPSLDDPLPAGWLRDPGLHADELSTRIRAAADRLVGSDATEILDRRADRFLSGRAQLAAGSISDRAAQFDIDDDSVVRRRPGSVCEVRVRDGGLVVLLGDRRVRMPIWLEPAMRRIVARDHLRVGDLADVVSERASRAVLVQRLIREGLLRADSPAGAQAGSR